MTATITESIEHLDFKVPCESTTCEVGNPPATFVVRMRCELGEHGRVYCTACKDRWERLADELDAMPIPLPHRACGSFDLIRVHGWLEPLS